ncbi:MAG: AbrB/MazE/SpoVT family DNA-binding domain-containing protein [Parcubacteria group bacterium]
MAYTTTVTQKGQITLPKSVRNKFNIKIREKVTIKTEANYIKVTPTQDILSIAGFLKKKIRRTDSVLKARENLERNYLRV